MATQDADEEEIIRLREEVVLYFLCQHSKNCSIKRPDLVKAVLKDSNRKTQNEVIKQSKEVLKKTYGLDVIELDESVKHYMLVNKIDYDLNIPLSWPEEEKREQTLLLPILSVIFMNGGSLLEPDLWSFLRKLKIVGTASRVSEEFGDLETMIKRDLVQQRYLMYQENKSITNDDPEDKVYEFLWGIRAEHEVSKEKILRHVCGILKCDITHFAEQYAQITQ